MACHHGEYKGCQNEREMVVSEARLDVWEVRTREARLSDSALLCTVSVCAARLAAVS